MYSLHCVEIIIKSSLASHFVKVPLISSLPSVLWRFRWATQRAFGVRR